MQPVLLHVPAGSGSQILRGCFFNPQETVFVCLYLDFFKVS